MYVFLTAVICLPVILSYAQLMPYYTRSGVVDHAATANLGFSIPSYLSFLSPVATIKGNFFQTDVSMRNGYFSLFGLIALICILIGKKDKTQKIFLSAAFAMLILSLGGLVKETLYEKLPLLAFIRTNGEFRVFALFSFIVCTGLLLHQSFAEDKPLYSLKRVAAFVAVIAIISAFIGLALLITKAHLSTPSAEGSFSETIKAALADMNFPQALLAGSVIAFFLSVVYWFLLKKARRCALHYFILADVILNAWLLLPVTGVGQKSVGYIATIINQAPKGFPLPSLNTTTPAKPVTPEDEKRIGDWNWFNKQLVHNQIEYPSILRSAQEFYTNASDPLQKKPFAFLVNGKGTLTVIKFGPSQIEFNATLSEPDTIVLKQNVYPGWNVEVDNLPVTLVDSDKFLSAALPKGNHKVSFHFSPKW
ncbi:MAG TPA: hypothetical protein VMR70_04750 [Flavisolibacter sp.]|nr:hypothetical protein [Flavisolibacter sp.]